jgi:hypothetical protein
MSLWMQHCIVGGVVPDIPSEPWEPLIQGCCLTVLGTLTQQSVRSQMTQICGDITMTTSNFTANPLPCSVSNESDQKNWKTGDRKYMTVSCKINAKLFACVLLPCDEIAIKFSTFLTSTFN